MYVREGDATGSVVAFALTCAGPTVCTTAPNADYVIDTVDVTLNDLYLPNAGTPTGSLVSRTKLVGDVSVAYPATDTGGGLFRTLLYDGPNLISRVSVDQNGGHCVDVSGDRGFDRRVP